MSRWLRVLEERLPLPLGFPFGSSFPFLSFTVAYLSP
jgi:hypothetical protein